VVDSKVATMRDAISELVHDGDSVAIEGFTHLIGFAAGHEIIRQRKRDLTLCRLTPDLIYDQMIAAGVARKLVFSWLGNPVSAVSTPFVGRRKHLCRPSSSRSTRTSGWSAATPRAR
jgi:acyl CoA:acetate/3-ketoacid CoA transferase alpha subunit